MFPQLANVLTRFIEMYGTREPLVLRPGQIVQGKLIELLGSGNAIVQIGAQKIRANTEVPLSPERNYWFQVHSSNDNRLILKVVEKEGEAKDIRQLFRSLFHDLNVKPTYRNLQAAEWLFKQNEPLTRQNVTELSSVLRTFGQTPQVEQALSLILSKQLPIKHSIVEAVIHAFTGKSLPLRINELIQQLQRWVQTDTTLSTAVKEQVHQTIRQLEQTIAIRTGAGERHLTTSLPASTSIPITAAKEPSSTPLIPNNLRLESSVSSQGTTRTSTEASIVNQTMQPLSERPELSAQAYKTGINGNRSVVTSQLFKWFQMLGIEREHALYDAWRQTRAGDRSLHVHEQVQVNVKDSVMRLLQQSLPTQIRELGEALIQHITGQQLLLSTAQESHWQHLLFYAPTPSNDRDATIHVFTRKKEGGMLDKDNCRLLFQLELDYYGWSCVVAHIVNRAISLEWYCDNEQLSHQLNHAKESLRKQLEKIGYSLAYVQVKPLEMSQTDVRQHVLPTIVNWGKGVDVRV